MSRRILASFSTKAKSTLKDQWKNVPMGPVDPILGVTTAFNNDPSEEKINVGVGAYRTEEGKPWVLPSVKAAEEKFASAQHNLEYLPIQGYDEFIRHAMSLLYGSSCVALKERRVAALQSLSGTGALRLIAAFLAKFAPTKEVYFSNPTWGNHYQIFSHAGLTNKNYAYWDAKNRGIDFHGMMKDLTAAPNGAAVVLHACAHNPTGEDLTHEQWREVLSLCRDKNFIVVLDCAYQGFASGDPERDGFAIRLFADSGLPVFVAQSFAKNMGLYGLRVGTVSAVCVDENEAARVFSQLKILARGMYSSPPKYGAMIAATVLGDPTLRKSWESEIKIMAVRIQSMRALLRKYLEEAGSKHNWSHITNQIGMFCYTGLTEQECKELTKKHHVYLTMNGRISLAGVTKANAKRLAEAIHQVSKHRVEDRSEENSKEGAEMNHSQKTSNRNEKKVQSSN